MISIDIAEQYDKIYRYCYFKLRNRELAEDITQETFLHYLEHYHCLTTVSALKCLYTIARNLCITEYRKPKIKSLDISITDTDMEERLITSFTIKSAFSKLSLIDQELLLLRYVNEVPVGVLSNIYGISRFSLYRKLTSASNRFREELQKEDYYESLER